MDDMTYVGLEVPKPAPTKAGGEGVGGGRPTTGVFALCLLPCPPTPRTLLPLRNQ